MLHLLEELGPVRELDFDAGPGVDDECLEVVSGRSGLQVLKWAGLARFKPSISGVQAKPGEDRLLKFPVWAAPIVSHGLLIVLGEHRIATFNIAAK
ncbi:MAG: hypothetical protein AB8B91_13560 [Rubripirellula sp.]